MQDRSRLAFTSMILGILALALSALGASFARLGVVAPGPGFRLYLLGAVLGLVTLVLGIIGLWRTRPAAQRSGQPQALVGTLIGAVLLLPVIRAGAGASDFPTINDITTDPADPPQYEAALSAEPNRGRDMSYPAEFAAIQGETEAYADIETLSLPAPPAEVFARVERAAGALGWSVTRSDPNALVLEASDTSSLFRFVDDVVVRVRPAGGGSEVDVRSKSRDGRGDLGVNAERIRALLAELR